MLQEEDYKDLKSFYANKADSSHPQKKTVIFLINTACNNNTNNINNRYGMGKGKGAKAAESG